MTRIRCSGKTVNCRIRISTLYHTPSCLDLLLVNIAKRFKPIRLFIYDDIISFSSAIYFLDVHSLCSVYILYSINATRRELSRNVNRKPVLHWNTQTVMEIRTRPTLFCHFKVAYTSGPIFEKIMKRYPIFSVQIINYQIDQKYK